MLGKIATCCAAALVAGTAYADGLDLDKVAGVYIKHFQNADITGRRFGSDDVLEIVKLSPDTAYFRTFLNFYNGHQCTMSGVAEVDGQSLVYRQAEPHCELHLNVASGKITFDDKDMHCHEESCGMRGGYNGAEFGLSSRRPIRYMTQLLASGEYRDALKAYQAGQGH